MVETASAPTVDLAAIAQALDCDLTAAFAGLSALYAEVDARNEKNTRDLALPCHRGCSMCCHESVFLTGLEFFYAWHHVQTQLDAATRTQIVSRGLALYETHRAPIEALEGPIPPGERDHFSIAKNIRFACPMLTAEGACGIYPARELLARLFGCSFNDEGGVYGCHIVGDHLAGKTVTLTRARPLAQRLAQLPLTEKRQVYPYWIHLLYGPTGAAAHDDADADARVLKR